MSVEVARIIDISLEFILIETVEIVILKELYAFAIFYNLDSGNEYLSFKLSGEWWSNSYNNSHIVSSS